MIFFYVARDIRVNPHGSSQPIHFKSPRPLDIRSRRIPDRHIYFTTTAQFGQLIKAVPDAKQIFQILDDLAVDMILNRDEFPAQSAFHQAGEAGDIFLREAETIKIAIINGMGIGIGDSIVGLRALEIFYERMRRNYSRISIDLYQRIKPKLKPLYQRSKVVNKVYMLPQSLDMLLKYDHYMSLEGFIQSQEFNSMSMIDYFLAKLGVDPASVPAFDKRNTNVVAINAKAKVGRGFEELLSTHKEKGKKLLLFHPYASDAIRSVPEVYISKLIDFLIANTDFIVASAVSISYRHERFIDLSGFSKGVDNFIDIISRMDAVVTVDTSAYHIADGFNIPAVVLFTTIPPQYRTVYYPHAQAVWLGEGKDMLSMRHKGASEDDLKMIDDIYRDFSYKELLTKLDQAIKSRA